MQEQEKKIRKYANMDLVRYALTIPVILEHCNVLLGTKIWWMISADHAVKGFFALSGFLMYGSYIKRDSWLGFVKSRAKRIVPPYVKIVLLCAIGLSLVSTLPLTKYFTDAGLWKYLAANLAFLNFLQPTLPGVFEHNNVDAVNGSLWTLKVEWMLYLTIPVFFFLIRKTNWKPAYIIYAIAIASIAYKFGMELMYESTGNGLYQILGRQFAGQLIFFYLGVLLSIYHNAVEKYAVWLLAVCLAVYATGAFIDSNAFLDIVLPMSFCTIVILCSTYWPLGEWTSRIGNKSYEVYLYHFPIIQLIANFM
ncbi:MAG: acyltransferase [Prevotella sp.]|nr:acyltransferase [Prevotella sp.]MBR6192197.1 acyltransferase [Prevotella sp.]